MKTYRNYRVVVTYFMNDDLTEPRSMPVGAKASSEEVAMMSARRRVQAELSMSGTDMALYDLHAKITAVSG